jgi:hypothetical protein
MEVLSQSLQSTAAPTAIIYPATAGLNTPMDGWNPARARAAGSKVHSNIRGSRNKLNVP